MSGIRIRALGRALPSRIMTNEDFEQLVETSDEWIRTRTGISSRHFCDPTLQEDAAALAVKAAEEAVQRAREHGISKEEIGLVIVATCSGSRQMPSHACFVQEKLKLADGIVAFDINVACSGFVYALGIADALMKERGIAHALVIGTEELSRLLDFSDRSTCVLFGDGAAAAVISLCEDAAFLCEMGSVGDSQALSCVGHIQMDGRQVFRFAVNCLEKLIQDLAKKSQCSLEDIDYIVCHQANKRIIEHVQKKLGLAGDKLPMNLMTLGNTSAASIPLMLYDLQEEGRLHNGTKLFCIGFGAGLSFGGAYLTF